MISNIEENNKIPLIDDQEEGVPNRRGERLDGIIDEMRAFNRSMLLNNPNVPLVARQALADVILLDTYSANKVTTRVEESSTNQVEKRDKNENVKVEFLKWKFFKTTLCSLILLAFYYVDIATDINLLIDYAAHKMWGYFTLTLLFILAPLLVQWIDTLISNRNKLRDYEIFLFVFWILLIPFYSIIL